MSKADKKTVLEIYAQKAIEADVSYGDLTQEIVNDPKKYYDFLTKDKYKIKLSPSQAKAFAGVTETKDKNGNIVRDDEGNIVYEFITKDVKQPDGSIKKVRAEGYSVVASYKDDTTGYYGVLLKNNETGELTISNRGTEPTSPEDIGDDISLIKKQVPEQFISMSTFMQKLINEGKITKENSVSNIKNPNLYISYNPYNKVTNSKNSVNHSIKHHIFVTEPDKIDKTLKYLNNAKHKEKRLIS